MIRPFSMFAALLFAAAGLSGCAPFHPNGRHLTKSLLEKYYAPPPAKAGEPQRKPASLGARVALSPAVLGAGILDALIVNPVKRAPDAHRAASSAGSKVESGMGAVPVLTSFTPPFGWTAYALTFPFAELAYSMIPGAGADEEEKEPPSSIEPGESSSGSGEK